MTAKPRGSGVDLYVLDAGQLCAPHKDVFLKVKPNIADWGNNPLYGA
jgi:hypothetical protein